MRQHRGGDHNQISARLLPLPNEICNECNYLHDRWSVGRGTSHGTNIEDLQELLIRQNLGCRLEEPVASSDEATAHKSVKHISKLDSRLEQAGQTLTISKLNRPRVSAEW
jgi:hypothetical protein